MPQDDDRSVAALKERAQECFRAAEAALMRTDIGEMERAIEEARQKSLGFNYLEQAAIEDDDFKLLKHAGEQSTKWATAMRQATTKRRNDIVPQLVELLMSNAAWSTAAKALSLKQDDD
jgi:hypothetical protein